MVVAVAGGIILGVASRAIDSVAPAWAGNSFALWILVAFLVALRATGASEGAARGCVALVVATCAYYAWRWVVVDDIGVRYTVRAFSLWLALAVPAGLSAGIVAQRGNESWALPAGAFAGEAAVTWIAKGRPLHAVLALAVGAALATRATWTRRAAALAVAGAVAVAVGVLAHEMLHA